MYEKKHVGREKDSRVDGGKSISKETIWMFTSKTLLNEIFFNSSWSHTGAIGIWNGQYLSLYQQSTGKHAPQI